MVRVLYVISILLLQVSLMAQYDEIVLNNPSFEGRPHRGESRFDVGIRGWYDCGELIFPTETPPDIHPINAWQVTTQPSEGISYLGMVVRDNDSWESVSQRIRIPLEEGKCYSWNIDLSRSPFYISGSKATKIRDVNYVEPAVLRIWGGTGVCGRQELLSESRTISNNVWSKYDFDFKPGRTLNYFTLEAFYKVPVLIPYNGHVLLDNGSNIREVPCDEEEIAVTVEETRRLPEETPIPVKEEIVPEALEEKPVTQDPPIVPAKKEEKLVEGLDAKTIKKGQVIRVNNIYFAADSSEIKKDSYKVLEEIYDFLNENKNIVVEIGGHTSTMPTHKYCDNLSRLRAREVASVLVRMGISTKRLSFKGYGKRKPIVRNDKFDMTARKKNQRVEIKILSISYSETG